MRVKANCANLKSVYFAATGYYYMSSITDVFSKSRVFKKELIFLHLYYLKKILYLLTYPDGWEKA